MAVVWTGTGTAAPFATLTATGLTIDLANAAFGSGQLRIGAETIDLTTLSATPQHRSGGSRAGGDERFAAVYAAVYRGARRHQRGHRQHRQSFNTFAAFVTQLNTTFATPTPATQFVARGMYDRASNTFTASSIDVVL